MTLSTLIKTRVNHGRYGKGEVISTSIAESTFMVEFEDGTARKFNYPDAFTDRFLTIDNNSPETGDDRDRFISLRERLLCDDIKIMDDMSAGKYRIDYDFGEAKALIPSLSILDSYVPTEDFWDLAVKFEFRLGKVISRMGDASLSISEILRNDYLNIYLTGEPGCGKTTMIEALCACFGLPFYVVNLSANVEEDEFTGTNKVYDGKVTFCETPFLKAYKYGGIVLLDEINAASPSVTITLNDVLIKPFTIYENNVTPRNRHPLCIIAAASNPDTIGICPLNEATERRFNVTRAVKPAGRDAMIRLLAKDYPEDMVRWACQAYERCKLFLKDRGADEVYRALSIDSIRAVMNDLEEGRDPVKSLDNYVAKAATRDPELASALEVLCKTLPKYVYTGARASA